jgi:hypothetical protein
VNPDDLQVRLDAPKETPIVTYCSVGYRSAKMAQRLQRLVSQTCEILKARFFNGPMKGGRSSPRLRIEGRFTVQWLGWNAALREPPRESTSRELMELLAPAKVNLSLRVKARRRMDFTRSRR